MVGIDSSRLFPAVVDSRRSVWRAVSPRVFSLRRGTQDGSRRRREAEKPGDESRQAVGDGVSRRPSVRLQFSNPLQLLIATILSAQCTDVRVNMVTPALFKKYPTAADFAAAKRSDLEKAIQSTGFFRNKAKSIQEPVAEKLVEEHGGKVPQTIEELGGIARRRAQNGQRGAGHGLWHCLGRGGRYARRAASATGWG